jgi:periplasmic protein CpxP/Spy
MNTLPIRALHRTLRQTIPGWAIAASVLIVPMAAHLATASMANAQPLGGPSLAQRADHRGNRPNLNLTDAQKTQLQTIRQQTQSQIQALLTPAQKDQLKTAMESGQPLRRAMANLNLSADQKTQLRTIMQSSKTQMDAILTPEQKQQMQEFRRSRRESLTPEQRQKLRERMPQGGPEMAPLN